MRTADDLPRAVSDDEPALASIRSLDDLEATAARAAAMELEQAAFDGLTATLARAPDALLQALVETALGLCRAGSAGVSLLDRDDGVDVFRWIAVAGRFAGLRDTVVTFDASPCGHVVRRDAMVLLRDPARDFPALAGVEVPVTDALLAPLRVDGRPVGTLWLVQHDDTWRFDREDVRLLERLRRFGSIGIQVQREAEAKRAAARARRESEARLRLFIEHAPAAIAMFDCEMRYLAASRRYAQDYRLRTEDLIGRVHYDVFPELPEHWRAIHARCLAGAVERNDREAFSRADGTVDWVRWELRPWHDDDGAPGGLLLFSEIVTERVRLEQELQASEAARRREAARNAFLLALEDRLRPLDEPAAICGAAARALTDELGVDRACYDLVDEPAGTYRIFGGCAERRLPGRLDVPLIKEGRLAAVLSVYRAAPREWTEDEIGLVEAVAARTWPAVERATAERARREAEARLARNAATFEQLIRDNPFGIYAIDADFRLQQVSKGAQQVFASVRPLLGRDFAEVLRTIWPEPFATDAIERFRHTLATGEPHVALRTVEQRLDVAGVEAYDWRIERLVLPDGRFGVVCYFYDLTEREQLLRQLRDSESFYRQTLESIPGMTFTTRPDGSCDYLSEQWTDFTGLSTAALLGDAWVAMLHPDDRPRAFAAWRAAVDGRDGYDLEYRVRHREGGYEWFRVRGRAIRGADGTVARWVGTAINVDALKRVEEALRDADRRKDRFIATLSHELRNPLAPIRNAAQVLTDPRLSPAQLSWAQAVIQRQVGQMAWLLDDLLDVARITQGKLELRKQPTPLTAAVDTAVEAARPLIDRKQHRLVVVLPAEPPVLDADPLRLAQILSNLLTNAAKYTDPGGRIELRAWVEDGQLALAVEDDGIGIPAGALASLFEVFSQVEGSAARSEGGLGLGLALVRGLVELHGGTVAAQSEGIGRGTCMTVRLPLPAAGAVARASATDDRAMPAQRRVLVADDNRDAADSLAMILALEGHEVRVAYDGASALTSASAFRPDVALLDIGMPGLSGHEVARKLRGEPWGAQMLLVALTGWGQDEDRALTRAPGFDVHLTKPVDAERLRSLVVSPPRGDPAAGRPP